MESSTYKNVVSGFDTIGNDFSIFSDPVISILESDYAECSIQTGIADAASLLSQKKATALLIKDEKNQYIGIVTDKDFREKVIAKSLPSTISVSEIMSSPLITVNPDTTVFEAIHLMSRKNIKHLVVQDDKGLVIGIISDHEIVTAQGHSPLHLLRRISLSKSPEDLFEIHSRLSIIVNQISLNGANIEIVNRFVTNISDEILKKIIEFAIQENGQAPIPFAFIVMGSEGRKEQTLKTDQDNAIIFQDSKSNSVSDNQEYFLKLGRTICFQLDKAGFKLCNGDVMAQNPKWCQPLSEWKEYFSKWINIPEPFALMHSSIFFDLRCGYGDSGLVKSLKKHFFEKLSGQSDLFYYHLAQNAIHSKPLLGLFNNIKVEKSGKNKNALDIKKAMTPIVNFARLYALHNKIEATNTINRLKALYELELFKKGEYDDYTQAYNFLMHLRFTQQLENILINKVDADNYLKPKNLSQIEQRMLKEIFMLTKRIQQKMSVKFTAIA